MNELALFAGSGGGILGGFLLGWKTICAVEKDPYCAGVLIQRQNEGILPPFPIWDDVCTFDGRLWRGIIDIVSGGFPCQDTSQAGKGAGLDGEKSGLWKEMARIIRDVRPKIVWVENSSILNQRGLDQILRDLAEMGYNARWGVLGADDAGANHIRKRTWILAYTGCRNSWECSDTKQECNKWNGKEESTNKISRSSYNVAHSDTIRLPDRIRNVKCRQKENETFQGQASPGCNIQNSDTIGREQMVQPIGKGTQGKRTICQVEPSTGSWWKTEPDVGRMADGVAARVDRLKAIGNGQVPAVVKLAWSILSNIR